MKKVLLALLVLNFSLLFAVPKSKIKDGAILIDVGINYSRIKETLDSINVNPHTIDGVLITSEPF